MTAALYSTIDHVELLIPELREPLLLALSNCIHGMEPEAMMAVLLSDYVPDSVRLELAALLNPWRPIETAPKDGTEILIGAFEKGVRSWFVVFWDDEPTYQTHHWQTPDGIAYHNDLPTHWLPLPAPPSED